MGVRSAEVARILLTLPDPVFARLRLEGEVAEAVSRARAIKAPGARRREERRLAGVLRAHDVDEVEAAIKGSGQTDRQEAARFQRAERWRARLVDDGDVAIEALLVEVPGIDAAVVAALVDDARHERDTGAPRGAARKLFRFVRDACDE